MSESTLLDAELVAVSGTAPLHSPVSANVASPVSGVIVADDMSNTRLSSVRPGGTVTNTSSVRPPLGTIIESVKVWVTPSSSRVIAAN